MKFLTVLVFLLFSGASFAHTHYCGHAHNRDGSVTWDRDCSSTPSQPPIEHHTTHFMVIYGEGEGIYASHVVYKQPHNYQVILKLNLDQESRSAYEAAARKYPGIALNFLLDHMDLRTITSAESISGMIMARKDGQVLEEIRRVTLRKSEFKVLYFKQLPLSLQ